MGSNPTPRTILLGFFHGICDRAPEMPLHPEETLLIPRPTLRVVALFTKSSVEATVN